MFFSVTLITVTLFVTNVHSQVGSALKEAPTIKPTTKKKLPKALVIYERKDLQYSHSRFFSQLASHADITYKSAISPNLSIRKFGVNQFNYIYLMAPSVDSFGGNVTSKSFGEFVDNGGNLVVATDHTIGNGIRNVGAQFGVEFDEDGTKVINNQYVDLEVDDGSHTSFVLMDKGQIFMGRTDTIVGDQEYYSIPWSGIGINLKPDHPYALPILKCTDSCYSWNPETDIDEYPTLMGRDVTLVAALQMQNGARVIFSGSILSFSNEQIHRIKLATNRGNDGEGNPIRIHTKNSLTKFQMHNMGWILNQKGRFRVKNYRHFLLDDIQKTKKFFVNDTVRFEIQIEEYISGQWFPITVNEQRFSFELNRMSTFVRGPMKNEGGGLLSAEIRLPDIYGIFDFVVKFQEPGFQSIDQKFSITINPISYDMYDRFIPSAFPYYLSAFSMMVGAFLISFTVLYHEGGDIEPRRPEPVTVTNSTPKIKAVPKRVKKRQ